MFRSIPRHLLEAFQSAPPSGAVLWTMTYDDVAGDDNPVFSIGKMQRVLVTRKDYIVSQHHPLASVPRAAAKGMTGIDDRIVNDLEIHRLPLMIGARET